MSMIKKIKKTIDRHQMLACGDTVVVALSGGADSCALLSLLVDLEKEYDLKIIVAHFNHRLRGEESDQEAEFCRNLVQTFGLRFELEKMASTSIPKGESDEDYFRNQRYCFLEKVAGKYGAGKIALGHHLNDQAETVLLNILRGSGLDGLKGILPVRDHRYIRPLIAITRQEIREYLQEKNLDYCNDSSNQNTAYLRNRIRLKLIPFLKEGFNPQIEQGLARMAEMIRRDHQCLESYVREILESENIQKGSDYISFSAVYFNKLSESIGFRLIKSLLEGMTKDGKGVYYTHIQSVADLARDGSTGKQISLPSGLTAIKQYDCMLIKKGKTADKDYYHYSLSIPGAVDLKERCIIITARQGRIDEIDFSRKNIIYLDLDKIKGALTLRNRRPGDWFEPLGTNGRQKIKKLFIDHKISRPDRYSLVLLTDEISVIWVENMHLCNRVKISRETSRVLVVEIKGQE